MDNGVNAKVDIIVELKKMNLTYEKLVEVGIKLMDNPKYIHLFWVFEEEQKTLFVIRPIQQLMVSLLVSNLSNLFCIQLEVFNILGIMNYIGDAGDALLVLFLNVYSQTILNSLFQT